MTQTTSTKQFQVDGAYKVTETSTTEVKQDNVTTKQQKDLYKAAEYRVEKVNDDSLALMKDMSNQEISEFMQKQMEAQNQDPVRLERLRVYEAKLDQAISELLTKRSMEQVTINGNVTVERNVIYKKNGQDIFYDPKLNTYLWNKTNLLLDRGQFSTEDRTFKEMDKEFLKDDILDTISIIKKSTWFIFKYSEFMPFWIETISDITDPDFLSNASKKELIYLHYYAKKLFKIFSKAYIGSKGRGPREKFYLIFSQVASEIGEYEIAIKLLFQNIDLESKVDHFKQDYTEFLNKQRNILKVAASIRDLKFMEPIDLSLTPEMIKLRETMDRMNKGVPMTSGDVEVTTIIKTKIIDIKKKIMRKISIILTGKMLEKFQGTMYYGHLRRILIALQNLLNSHMLDNDSNVETILASLDLFLIALENYLDDLTSEETTFSVTSEKHKTLVSSLMYFISKVETAEKVKTNLFRKQYTLFILRVRLFLMALEMPIDSDQVNWPRSQIDETNSDLLPDNLDDLFGEFSDLLENPNQNEKVLGLKKAAERVIYMIDNDIEDREIDPKNYRFFKKFKDEIDQIAKKPSMLQPFYRRMHDIFTETEKGFRLLGTLDFVMKLQQIYLKVIQIQQSQVDFEETVLDGGDRLGRVQYEYKTYRDTLHALVPEVVKHISFVCNECDGQVLNNISNEMSSNKDSLVDAMDISNRLKMTGDDLQVDGNRRVYVVEVLDCENSNIFIKLVKKNRRMRLL